MAFLMHGAEIIDRFIAEITASKKYAEAAATDAILRQHVDDMEKALRGLWRLGDEDVRALDLSDEALSHGIKDLRPPHENFLNCQ